MIDHRVKIEVVSMPVEDGAHYQRLMEDLDEVLFKHDSSFEYVIKASLETFVVNMEVTDAESDEEFSSPERTLLPANGREDGLPGVPLGSDEQEATSV